ncbi:2-succinyl-5-enolpyruvyl-6-hydroxy-3- cyclohexene-1-carboxylic-acid synthase [Synechococcus sp. PROS-7-1]|uniref:2-succinyl-5-enolpyruvyl-6-hydroxy-3- cyclohexene-1-carboxylic-acid synthase n=1 Tax=Synechococcus sp. PROS-7-1 TaxID=1442556 RepID=UPI0016450AA6|nr:2-succinyl-5-enolpyruvyl-6-hydroxy-3-cyclohexene-1-carboxylic-acid synthase [Synechococcus sp. PROS-7-1]QNI84995.1 2-succinyl-5-enolpyruvyl-6-hydroxy-3- cyclohexene-1-carboxylic-acid synthase [Synechococcus sp. PROS-7-1]
MSLLAHLQHQGLRQIVLCPGSRSAPLALAAGGLARQGGLTLVTAIDERSAGFHALGLALASGRATAVITTSGTAVANLLPAAVEADRSCIPLLLLTADRPTRLKDCGANQTVNQEQFLAPVCRAFLSTPGEGLHHQGDVQLQTLASTLWERALGSAGPVHLNVPFEEPLHPSESEQQAFWSAWQLLPAAGGERCPAEPLPTPWDGPVPDWSRPGVVVAGPWRGLQADLPAYQRALQELALTSGWPVLLDPLAAAPQDLPGVIRYWDLMLPAGLPTPEPSLQVLRLGPLPASRRLEAWLRALGPGQWLISEGDCRSLDPLGLASQCSLGLSSWWQGVCPQQVRTGERPSALLTAWRALEASVERALAQHLPPAGPVSEPALMRRLPQLLPPALPVMLAASSPVRDWLAFAAADSGQRRCFSFRGASGIDGTLSLAVGLSRELGPLVLLTGDLALLHDSNGWLLASASAPPLLVLLIDNGGGGIFGQLPIPTVPAAAFDHLFAMPQAVDPLALARAHGVPTRQLACLEDLPHALEWGLDQRRPVLLRVCTNRMADAALRQRLRREVEQALCAVQGSTKEG